MALLRDIRDPSSRLGWIAQRARARRLALFRQLFTRIERPLSILDVGGTPTFWETMNLVSAEGVSLTIVNLVPQESIHSNLRTIEANACDLHMFGDGEFDVVFSNSVIEHVGGPEQQARMAHEIRRLGKRYFVQTPNRHFPIEPHFMFPFFQFLPIAIQKRLLMHLALAWSGRIRDPAAAESVARSVRLLGRKQFTGLFPDAEVWEERILGLTKSYVCYAGW